MPDVIVRRSEDYLPSWALVQFFKDIQIIVAEVLTVPGTVGELTKDDIVIRDFIHGEFDIGTKDIEITVTTGDMPDRRLNLQERTEQAAAKIMAVLPIPGRFSEDFWKGRCNVWIILVTSGFHEF